MSENAIEILRQRRAHRIGLMGGTFDPIHRAHVEMARRAMEQCKLDAVLFLVSGDPPHKSAKAPAADRFAMLELALSEEEGLYPSRVEIDRTGTVYTVDTLHILRRELPDAELYYIVGSDTLNDLKKGWRSIEEIYGLTKFIVFVRQGYTVAEDLDSRLRAEFAEMPAMPFSSTEIRRRVAQDLPFEDMVAPAVAAYIRKKGLYCNEGMTFEEAKATLEGMVKPSRFRHTLGVVDTAEELAIRFGADVRQARWAGLLHDCAKGMGFDESVAAAKNIEPPVDLMTLSEPSLIHAPLGAYLAQQLFGVDDPEVLEAIRCHTTGKIDMAVLDMVLYVADMAEPNRDYPGVDKIRKLMKQDLMQAALAGMDSTIGFVIQSGGVLHPDTVDARNDLVIKLRQRQRLNSAKEENT